MAQLTIEIPDDLAQRLAPFNDQLSELFTRLIATTLPGESSLGLGLPATAELPPTYLEVLDFLVARPTSEQLLTFKVSEQSQVRLQALLQKNRDTCLDPSETAELDVYEQLDALMTLLKARAYAATQNISDSPYSV
ncbi:MAG: hypothetical protein KME15_19255 [Drouetiella hepatica Uher 2000/2452]|jgi:hypothetical protein|uniref:Uncharacterized protein n=1 Tax=Drouetiella hepatica Uher 2000/2452 TaxID=904376 RepID=A0A951UQV3_9CYAN|nr:hypothetical protein [Drouetiella hepatica Uher 2000/2452]